MPVDPVFAGSLIDGSESPRWSTTRLLGRRLRPFSLWHRLLLKTVASPFITGGRATMWDLRVAVGICRLEYGNSRIQRPWLSPTLICTRALLSRKPRDGQPSAIQGALSRLADQFVSYTADYTQEPEYAIIPPDRPGPAAPKVPSGRAPEELEQVCEIVAAFRCSFAEAWNMPVGLSNWKRAIAIRQAGHDVDFTSVKEKQFRETLPASYRHARSRA